MQEQIEGKLSEALQPLYLEVINESHMHGGPATDSHFKVIVVSHLFEGKRLLARHRMVNEILKDELAGVIHALAMHTYSREEWQVKQDIPDSPPCLGGSKSS